MANYTLMRAPERGFWHLQKKKEYVELWLPCLVDNLEQDLVLLCSDGELQASQAMLAVLSPTFLLPLMQTQVSVIFSVYWLTPFLPPGVLWVRWPDLRPSLFHQPAGGAAPPGD